MEIITSKNLGKLLVNTLKLIDKRPMEHGVRVAYILLKMLQCKGGYVEYELAEYIILAVLHDIGAYKTEVIDNFVTYETKEVMAHSIYGSLFMRYLTPMKEKAKIILYHHIDYEKKKSIEYEYMNISDYLSFAERLDLHYNLIGPRFDYRVLDRYENKKYSSESISLFRQAQIKYDILGQLESGKYVDEIDQILNYILFNDEEKKQYLEMMMYTIGFRSDYAVTDTVTTICICREIAAILKISEEDSEKLYYATLLHDVGMLAVSPKILDAPRALTQEEIMKMRAHVSITENLLKRFLDPEVVKIATAHHERLDGSGYYKGLTDADMDMLQKILQIADMVTGMINKRSYRKEKKKEYIIDVLEKEANSGKLSKIIVKIFIRNYDEIMSKVKNESNKILQIHTKLNTQYSLLYQNFY
ncbi:MAG: HD domain-containing protein [Clostridia bacterium]|nr:HD domain-containing protein [Clostridia bacterium]